VNLEKDEVSSLARWSQGRTLVDEFKEGRQPGKKCVRIQTLWVTPSFTVRIS
jgi:hypothetical protein